MTDRFAFDLVRDEVVKVKNGLLYNMNQDRTSSLPVVVSIGSVEEDGHIWLWVNSKSRKWEDIINIPVRVQFISESNVIDLNGIARFVEPNALPTTITSTPNTSLILQMKVYYGEIVPFVHSVSSPFQFILNWFNQHSRRIPSFTNRRMFIFR